MLLNHYNSGIKPLWNYTTLLLCRFQKYAVDIGIINTDDFKF